VKAVLTRRLAAGFAAMPFVAALSAFLFVPFMLPVSPNTRSSASDFEISAAIGVHLFIVAIVIVVVEAGPLFFWWQRNRTISFSSTMLWAAVLGNTPTVLAAVIFVAGRSLRGQPFDNIAWLSRLFIFGTMAGLLCGCAFWLIALHPGRTQTPSLP
jgi:hypothetical protein